MERSRWFRRILHGRDATVRLHDPHFGGDSVFTQPAFQAFKIARRRRPNIGVHRRGRKPLVFANDVHHLVRAANKSIRNHPLDDVARLHFVLVVKEREQEADHDRFQPALLEDLRRRLDLIECQWNFDLPGRRPQPLVHHQAVSPLDQRLRLPGHVELQRESMRPLVTGHMQNVAEAAGGDHADVGTLALDHHVGGDGRAVQHHVDVAQRDAGDLTDFDDAVHDADRLIRRRRGHLVHEYLLTGVGAGLFQDDVSERPSDVNADTYHFPLPTRRCRPRGGH